MSDDFILGMMYGELRIVADLLEQGLIDETHQRLMAKLIRADLATVYARGRS